MYLLEMYYILHSLYCMIRYMKNIPIVSIFNLSYKEYYLQKLKFLIQYQPNIIKCSTNKQYSKMADNTIKCMIYIYFVILKFINFLLLIYYNFHVIISAKT